MPIGTNMGAGLPICERLRNIARLRLVNPDLAIEWQAADTIEMLVEALHNMVALAEPHFSDASQTLALNDALNALAKARGQ